MVGEGGKVKHPGLIEEEVEDKGAEKDRVEEEEGGVEMVRLGGEQHGEAGDQKVEADKADEEAASEWGDDRKVEAEATQLQPPTSPRSFPLLTTAEVADRGDAGVGAAAAAGVGDEEGMVDGSVAAPNSPAHGQYAH